MKVDYRLDDTPVCPALYKRPGEGPPPWQCYCRRPDGRRLLRSRRHAYEWQCLSDEDVRAWWMAHPECKGTIDKARIMCWLEKNFGGKR